jgi:predicted dehydrogenase/nucleoside-diphosphate-sugar epimerase
MTLRVAFIGAGQMARHHASAVRRLDHPARIVGVFDSASDQADSFAALTGARAFPTAEALLRDAQADVVHVCTPPRSHFEVAMAAIESGAHVYVEKPFTLSLAHARELLKAAERGDRLVCAGHQLLRDPAFDRLARSVPDLGSAVQVDSHFAFRPAGMSAARMSPQRLSELLIDVLPHPLYALVSLLERTVPGSAIELAWAHATDADLQATLRAGDTIGRLSVSLRARPVASSLTFVGTRGTLACDFVRSMIVGVPNPGTEPFEKLLNPMVDGAAAVARTGASVVRRLRSGGYAGLPELIGAFYQAVATGAPSPTSPSHLVTVTELFEDLAGSIEAAVRPARIEASRSAARTDDLVAVTGAAGFLGAEIARALPRVRRIGRRPEADGASDDFVAADLARGLSPAALEGVDVVVHAAAATSGGFTEHQRNTIDATRHVLAAMHAANVRKLVLVSSLSVLSPPRSVRERQTEDTPRPADPRPYGAYTWGKCLQEALVEKEAGRLGIDVRIVRPGALLDRDDPDLPGLVGRRLFGTWHLGLGRPGLPAAVCDVDTCAAVISWTAMHFDDAPRVVNLFDPAVRTRRDLLRLLRTRGWNGRTIWVPISLLAAGVSAAGTVYSLMQGRRPGSLAAWSVLRPRRYDDTRSTEVLAACHRGERTHRRVPQAEMQPVGGVAE